MTKVLIVRHGETTWNAGRRIQGHRNSPLSELGLRQADAVRDRLQTLNIVAVYSSDLSRAVDTISPVARALGLSVQETQALREKSYGDWEGMTPEEIDQHYPGMWQQYRTQRDPDFVIPGGETWEHVRLRATGAMAEIVSLHGPNDVVAVATHGGTLRVLVLNALNAPLTSLFHMSIDNGAITRIDYRAPGDARVVTMNDRAHLESVE